MANSNMPEDVVSCILLELPVMSLLRFRSVCKMWYNLIGSSSFINKHLLHQKDNNKDSLIVASRQGAEWFLLSGHRFQTRLNLDLKTQWSLYFPPDQNDFLGENPDMEGSCNGIICLSRNLQFGRQQLILWNPSIKEMITLPDPPLFSTKPVYAGVEIADSDIAGVDIAFGHAVQANVYKVARVVEYLNPDFSAYLQVEAYNIQTGSTWRNVGINLCSGLTIPREKTYCSGHYFWLVRLPKTYDPPENYSIPTFDWSFEVFGTMLLPDILSTKAGWPHLTTISDSIACIDNTDPSYFTKGIYDVWVLTEYGVKESWTKLYTIRLITPFTSILPEGINPSTCVQPEGFSKNGQFLFLLTWMESGSQLLLYDLNTEETKNLHIESSQVAIYNESLVSVKKMMLQIQ